MKRGKVEEEKERSKIRKLDLKNEEVQETRDEKEE